MIIRWLILVVALAGTITAEEFQDVDFPAAQAAMVEKGRPLVLYVATTTCPFCKRLDNEVMKVVTQHADYKDKLTVQKLWWDLPGKVVWQEGERLAPDDIVTHYNVFATPTLLFLGPDGEEIAKRLQGYSGDVFYWTYLDERIANAHHALQ